MKRKRQTHSVYLIRLDGVIGNQNCMSFVVVVSVLSIELIVEQYFEYRNQFQIE